MTMNPTAAPDVLLVDTATLVDDAMQLQVLTVQLKVAITALREITKEGSVGRRGWDVVASLRGIANAALAGIGRAI